MKMLDKKFSELSKEERDKCVKKFQSFKNIQGLIKQLFKETDTDKSGSLNYDEFKVYFNKLFVFMDMDFCVDNEDFLKSAFDAYDENKNGKLDKKEFIPAVLKVIEYCKMMA